MKEKTRSAYSVAGVDIEAQNQGLREVGKLARATFTPGVLSDIGSFGGLFRPDLAGMTEPVLVASADGVGTKLAVARMAGDYSTVGRDLVNHCVNDILVQGARPLFFLDYVGAGVLEPAKMIELVRGVADGCRENGCALLGGETAEMPGFYQPGDYELVGFIVGLADRANVLTGARVADGDILLALPSAGLHTNGYSLARKVLFGDAGLKLGDRPPELGGQTVADALLAVHRSYLRACLPLVQRGQLTAMAHITGGGLPDNVPRSLPPGAGVRIDARQIPRLPICELIVGRGKVARAEAYRVLNMGVGMVLFVRPKDVAVVERSLRDTGEEPFALGEVVAGDRTVVFV